jgi:hypothetical protein
MAGAPKREGTGVVLMTVLAAPVALAFETAVRLAVFPPELSEVRDALRPALTPWAWAIAGLAATLAVVGVVAQKKIVARRVARIPEAERTPERVARARLGAFLFAASIPQVPSVIGTVMFTMGASLVPVLVCIGVVTVAVCAQAVMARRDD